MASLNQIIDIYNAYLPPDRLPITTADDPRLVGLEQPFIRHAIAFIEENDRNVKYQVTPELEQAFRIPPNYKMSKDALRMQFEDFEELTRSLTYNEREARLDQLCGVNSNRSKCPSQKERINALAKRHFIGYK
jgi:hypothetical protein